MTTREQRLRELVEKWRNLRHQPFSAWDEYGYATYEVTETCADELSAILAETVEVSEEMLERASWASCLRCCDGDEDASREEWTKYAANYWEDAKVMLTAALKEPGQ